MTGLEVSMRLKTCRDEDTARKAVRAGTGSSSGPPPSWHQGLVLWKTIFPHTGVGGGMVSG